MGREGRDTAMSTDLSPENENFIQTAIAGGVFQDRSQALNEAVELLRRRQRLLDHIGEGTQQLRSNQAIELRGDEELNSFFAEIQTEGQRRYDRREKSP